MWSSNSAVCLAILEHEKVEFELKAVWPLDVNSNNPSTLFRFGSLNRIFYIKLKEYLCFRNFLTWVVYEVLFSKHFFDIWLYLLSASLKTYWWRTLVLHRQQFTDHCPFFKYFKIQLFSINCLPLLLWRCLCLKPSSFLARGSCIIIFFKRLNKVMFSLAPLSSFWRNSYQLWQRVAITVHSISVGLILGTLNLKLTSHCAFICKIRKWGLSLCCDLL